MNKKTTSVSIILTAILCILLSFSSCSENKIQTLTSENFFSITESGAVSLSATGKSALSSLYNDYYSPIALIKSDFKLAKEYFILQIPKKINDTDVVEIADDGFSYAHCDEIIIPDSVVKIGKNAFRNCKAEKINLPSSLETIGDYAFADMENKKKTAVTLPQHVASIGTGAFSGWSKIELHPENTAFKTENNCLLNADGTELYFTSKADNKDTELIIPSTVTTIKSLSINTYKKIKIPVSVTKIERNSISDTISAITYEGTYEQWQAITLENNWCNVANRTSVIVSCTDKDIAIGNGSGYIHYPIIVD